MKLLILFALIGAATASSMFSDYKKMKAWAKEKAMEQCFGEDFIRQYTVKMKKASAKCTGMEAPELDLPMFKSPMRFIQSLMHGVRDKEHEKADMFMEMIRGKSDDKPTSQSQAVAYIPYPMMPQQTKEDGDMKFMKKMMMMMMFKKMMKKMKANKKTPFGYMPEDDDDDNDEEGGYFRNMENDVDIEDFFNAFISSGEESNKRNKRAVTDGELLDLGEKLVEKLKMQQQKMMMKMSNVSCVLEELSIIDDQNNLDLASMLRMVKTFGIKDEWFEKKVEKLHRLCYAKAESTPREILNEYPDEKWFKIKCFMQCAEKYKMKLCMMKDVKDKLEENFKPLDELVEDTGMREKTLLMMTQELLSESFDM